MSISITYKIADNGTYDTRGRKQARVVETYEGIDEPERVFVVPGIVVESFIRARRSIAERVLASHGYAKSEPINWNFLEQRTKQ